MKKYILKYSYLFLLYPFFLLSIVITFNTGISFAPERVIFFYLLFYFLAFFISNKSLAAWYVSLIYICSVIITFFEIGYVYLYKERITPSTSFILLETNTSEVREYLAEYFDTQILLYLFLLIVPSFFILKGVNKLIRQFSFKEVLWAIGKDINQLVQNKLVSSLIDWLTKIYSYRGKRILLGFVILIVGITIYIKSNHHKYFVLFQLYDGYKEYLEEIKRYDNFSNTKWNTELLTSVKSQNTDSIKETYVLIIGESTTRNHLGLYNYYRNTTPNLNKIKEELVVFDNVISPHTHTIPSLEKVLTFGDRENPEKKYEGSIIQLMKQAGFKTYWISNQVPVGINETMVAMIAKASDYTHFTNLGGEKEMRTLDERVLPYFEKILKEKQRKKFIIIHLLGTHTQYKNRYPDKFNQFQDNPPTIFPSEEAFSTINEYDNAILYNDYILGEIIGLLKKNTNKTEKTFALYFSDHGEDVFEVVNFTGHSEVIGTKPMFQIPFIFWSNNKKELDKLKPYSNRRYMTDDLIYSIVDLANITFLGYTPEKSIFNDSLARRSRVVRDNIDFDEYFIDKEK